MQSRQRIKRPIWKDSVSMADEASTRISALKYELERYEKELDYQVSHKRIAELQERIAEIEDEIQQISQKSNIKGEIYE